MKYLTGDTDGAKNCYERTLAFVADASEMHSIYLRLASIYLQEGQVWITVDNSVRHYHSKLQNRLF